MPVTANHTSPQNGNPHPCFPQRLSTPLTDRATPNQNQNHPEGYHCGNLSKDKKSAARCAIGNGQHTKERRYCRPQSSTSVPKHTIPTPTGYISYILEYMVNRHGRQSGVPWRCQTKNRLATSRNHPEAQQPALPTSKFVPHSP